MERKLEHVQTLNREWQVYNEKRELHVQDMTRKYHEMSNRLRQANEENCRLHSRSEQLKNENQSLVTEMTRLAKVDDQLERTKSLLELETEKCDQYEQDINILNNRIDKLENENSKLVRAIRKDRRRSDMAQLSLEHSIVELTDKLDELSSQGSIDNYQVDYRSDNFHTSPRKHLPTPTRRSIENTHISCETCGKTFPVADHQKLLRHIDVCEN